MDTLTQLISEIDISAPWNHARAEEFDNMSVSDFIFSCMNSPEAIKEALLLVKAVIAIEAEECSMLFYLFLVQSGGGIDSLGDGEQGAQKWYIVGGSQQISVCLTNVLQENGVQFYFSDPVAAIDQVVGQSSMMVTTRSGCKFEADHVVVAMAPNLALKHIQFNPPLPKNQVDLYSSISGGLAIKTIILFKEAFWLRQKESAGYAGHFSDTGPVQNMFHAEVGGYPGLVCLSVGEPAKALLNLREDERKHVVLSQIKTLHEPVVQALFARGSESDLSADTDSSASDSDSDIITPKKSDLEVELGVVHFIDKVWARDEFSGGCFCGIWKPNGTFFTHGPMYLPRVADDGSSVPSVMKEDWFNLNFASTETSDCFVGYMEGALRAGEMAAAFVLNRI